MLNTREAHLTCRVLIEALRNKSRAASGTSGKDLQYYPSFRKMPDRYKMQEAREYTTAVTVVSHPLHSALDQDRGDKSTDSGTMGNHS